MTQQLLGIFALVVSLLSSQCGVAQTVKIPAGSLRWSANRPLTVADFKGRAKPGELHAALTSANINTGASCHGNLFMGTARASFDPASSWVRDATRMTPALLRHEQLHFDIAEVYARRLRQQLGAMRVPCDKLGSAFDQVSKAVYATWAQAEDAYDRDTNHGLQHEQQARWEALVKQQLLELADFAEEEA